MEQKYTILDSTEVQDLEWGLTHQTPDSIRYNLEGTRAIISVNVDSDYLSNKVWYNVDELREMIYTSEWNDLLSE